MQTKKQRITVVLIAAGLGLANAGVQAQETVPPDQSRTKDTESYNRSDYARSGDVKHGQHVKASKLIGTEVKNDQGDRLGKIDDLIISHNNSVRFVVLSVGGELGIGDRKVAVPINNLRCSDGTARLSATSDQLKNASKTTTGWTAYSGQAWARDVDGFYGKPSVKGEVEARTTSHFHRASKLIGMQVKNEQDERLGKVKDLVLAQDNSVKFAIVSVGGAAGIGDKQIAVPMNDLNHSVDTIRLSATADEVKNASKTPTGEWMAYSDQEWARGIDGYYSQPGRFGETTRTYERESIRTSPDREPVRTRQREFDNPPYDRDLLPKDNLERNKQGAAARDLITHPDHADVFNEPLIGKERTDNYNRSNTALTSDEAMHQRVCDSLRQNYSARTPETVSVTVQDGVVTLRGTVVSASEKRNIETTVKQMSGVRRVNNQLTVQNR